MTQYQMNKEVVKYKSFPEKGSSNLANFLELMPLLVQEGRRPISFAEGMRKRLEVMNSSEEVRNSWHHNGFWTGDGLVRFPNGDAKIIYNSEQLKKTNPTSKLSGDGGLILEGRGLVLEESAYDLLNERLFTLEDVEKYGNRPLSREQAKNNLFWKVLAQDNQKLLEDYVDLVFSVGKHNDDTMMGVYFPKEEKIITLRPWWLGIIFPNVNINSSNAFGKNHLLYDYNRRMFGVFDSRKS